MTDAEKNDRIRDLLGDVELAVIELEGGYFNGDFRSFWAALNELRELAVQPEWAVKMQAWQAAERRRKSLEQKAMTCGAP